ncbi:hypothetical protein J3L16_13265 [Alteromonas sp. 5E99-2]|uniref:hypothetical protein n=1 Tax=Alteromonas sp. 5E99-2 TaxID=2817683 RepID=UPI001A99B546|nr:hypothetical protein [Alteromonas sp. 5E99-2]MBO1256655.1 hypothetical protein [Alteromonas sp. 5E99-2]
MSRKQRLDKNNVTSVNKPQLVPQELEKLKVGETAVINNRTYMLVENIEAKVVKKDYN